MSHHEAAPPIEDFQALLEVSFKDPNQQAMLERQIHLDTTGEVLPEATRIVTPLSIGIEHLAAGRKDESLYYFEKTYLESDLPSHKRTAADQITDICIYQALEKTPEGKKPWIEAANGWLKNTEEFITPDQKASIQIQYAHKVARVKMLEAGTTTDILAQRDLLKIGLRALEDVSGLASFVSVPQRLEYLRRRIDMNQYLAGIATDEERNIALDEVATNSASYLEIATFRTDIHRKRFKRYLGLYLDITLGSMEDTSGEGVYAELLADCESQFIEGKSLNDIEYYEKKIAITHAIAKKAKGHAQHAFFANTLQDLSQKAFDTTLPYDIERATGYAGFPVATATKTGNVAQDLAYTEWGIGAFNSVIEVADKNNDKFKNYAVSILNKLLKQREELIGQKNTAEA